MRLATTGSYVVLDAYFAAGSLIATFREHQLHLISRVRINTVGKRPLPPPPLKRGRGKPHGENEYSYELYSPQQRTLSALQ